MRKEGMFYRTLDDSFICGLCPHECRLSEEKRGICGVRTIGGGKLRSLSYGMVSSIALDPIEKKPLYHYKPGKYVLSVGGFGCNFKCGFCQNYRISMENPETRYIPPEVLIDYGLDSIDEGNIGIAFTYNEPTVWYEYVYDTAVMCKNNGLDVILVTNGYINREPLEKLLPYVDAMNIDLKAFNENFYKKVCGGDISSVLKTIELAASRCHVEITTLIVNGYNDSIEEIGELSRWISKINPDIPLHLSRYYPSYKFNEPSTPIDKVMKCVEEARKSLNYVYPGNIPGVDTNTYCPECGNLIIDRNGYDAKILIDSNVCSCCGKTINIVL